MSPHFQGKGGVPTFSLPSFGHCTSLKKHDTNIFIVGIAYQMAGGAYLETAKRKSVRLKKQKSRVSTPVSGTQHLKNDSLNEPLHAVALVNNRTPFHATGTLREKQASGMCVYVYELVRFGPVRCALSLGGACFVALQNRPSCVRCLACSKPC